MLLLSPPDAPIAAAMRAVALAPAESRLSAFENAAAVLSSCMRDDPVAQQEAVDALHDVASSAGLYDELGIDGVQATLARAFELGSAGAAIDFDGLANADLDAIALRQTDVMPSAQAFLVRADEVEPMPVEYLWSRRIARGKSTLVGGWPGVSKSTLLIDLAARVSTGAAWPDGQGHAPRGNAVILSAEDGIADTLIPRLIAAGGDRRCVHFLTMVNTGSRARPFSLLSDVHLLEAKLCEIGDVALVGIDPLTAYIGHGQIDSHRNSDVRSVLMPVAEMADRHNVAVVGITHLSKAQGPRALARFMGSIAFVAAARAAFLVIDELDGDGHATGRKLMLQAKNNLAPPQPGLAYRVAQRVVDHDIVASFVEWDAAPVTATADEALAAGLPSDGGERSSLDEAVKFLRESLAGGPAAVTDVQDHARALGIAERTLARARAKLKAKASKDGIRGGWVLSLPAEECQPDAKDAKPG
jgi:hypothetical protein